MTKQEAERLLRAADIVDIQMIMSSTILNMYVCQAAKP